MSYALCTGMRPDYERGFISYGSFSASKTSTWLLSMSHISSLLTAPIFQVTIYCD